MEKIGGFLLRNGGWFICQGELRILRENGAVFQSEGSGRLAINQSAVIRPPTEFDEQDRMSLFINVLWGRDRDCQQYYLYDAASTDLASYEITGTTLFSTVHFRGLVKAP